MLESIKGKSNAMERTITETILDLKKSLNMEKTSLASKNWLGKRRLNRKESEWVAEGYTEGEVKVRTVECGSTERLVSDLIGSVFQLY